jgi:TonB-linked SusC/RagA family outer membrane protein
MQDGMGTQVSADEIVYGGTRSGDDLLSTINPDDIESMTILKGPNAAALYGSAANNGVIVITTKTGQSGAVKVDISSTTSFEQIATYPKIQQQFGAGSLSGSMTGWGPQIGTRDADDVASYPWLSNSARNAVSDFFGTGITTNNGVTLSGGTDLSRTYFSYNNTYQQGIIDTNKFYRNSVMLKETFSLFNKRVNITTSLNWVNQSTKNAPVVGRANSSLYSLYRTAADIDMRYFKNNYYHAGTTADKIISDPDRGNTNLIGQPIQTWSWYDQYLNNPYWIANMINNTNNRDRLLGNITLDVKIWKNLKYQTRFNLDYVKTYTLDERYASLNITNSGLDLRGGQYNSSNSMSSEIYNDHMLTWNDTFNDLIDVSAAAGGSFKRDYSRSTSISTYISIWGLPNAFVPQNSATNTDASTTGASDSWHNRDWSAAAFVTASVGWKDRIYLDGSYRLEWAQAFQQFTSGSGYKSFGYYSAGLNVLLDKFLPKYDWLNQLKWRGSYSLVGNPIPNTLYARQSYNFSTGAITSRTPTFDDPQPETTRAFETGLDVWMFNNKFNFDLTYYNSTLKNQFMYITTASGESKPVNTGKIRNYGLEFSASYRYVINKDWTWRTGFNVAWNDNRILETYKTESGAPYEVQVGPKDFKVIYKEGGRYGDIYVNSFARDENGYIVLLNEGDIENAAPQMASGTYDTYVGNTTSPVQLGWNNTINWRNLSFYFLIDGRIGGNVMSMTESDLDLYGLSQRTADARLAALADPELQGPNGLLLMYLPDGSGRKVSIQKYYETIGSLPMEDHVYDATSFRVRDISLSYLFPNLLGGGRDLTAQFSVKNAFFLYKNSPVDPDISMTAANGLSGIDNYALPTTRSFAVTLKLNF